MCRQIAFDGEHVLAKYRDSHSLTQTAASVLDVGANGASVHRLWGAACGIHRRADQPPPDGREGRKKTVSRHFGE